MPAAMHISSRKRVELKALAMHAFREGAPAESVDPARSYLNKALHGEANAMGALGAMPQQQPDGRKIRSDANLGTSMVFTLPDELAHDDEQALDAWTQATMDWIRDNAPGEVAYAVMHRDEPGARPHIHAMMLPMDEKGTVNYKLHYGRKDLFEELQDSYTDALLPLGVTPNSPETRAMLKPTYTPFANPEGAEISRTLRKVPGAAGRLAEKEREQTARKGDADRADQDLEQRATAVKRRARWLADQEAMLATWREALTTWRDGALETVRRQMARLQVLLEQAASTTQPPSPEDTGGHPLQPDDGADAAQPQPQDDRPTAGPAP